MSHLPLKKRALNDGGGRGSSPDDSPKKTRMGGCVGAENKDDDAGGREAPVPRPVPAAGAVAAASAKAGAKAEAFSAATKWLKKGKWIAPKQGSPAVVAPQPPAKKFMHDGIRSFAPSNERRRHAAEALAVVAAAGDEKKRSRSDGFPRPDAEDADDLCEPLRRRLAELGATRPRFVYRKALQKSDVCTNQNRLLVSCKRETGLEGCPITACFSPREWQRVRNKDVGLVAAALDRDGVAHTLTCKFLQSNGGYRFISGWKDFLKRNGMELDSRGRWTRDVDVELCAFRSRALKRQPPVDENGKLVRAIGEGGKPDKERRQQLQVPDHFHPDGSLGLVLLHHEHRRRAVDRDDDDFQGTGPSLAVASEKPKKQRVKPDAPAPTAASSPAVRAGAAAEPGESAPPETMSKVEMIDKYGEPISSSMIGLIMLRGVSSEERQDVETGAVSMEKQDNADAEGGHGA